MVSRDTTINDTLDLLAELQSKEDQLRTRLAEIETEREAVQTTLRLFQARHQSSPQKGQQPLVPYALPDIRGKTQKQAIDTISDANGGELRLSPVRKHMLASGFFRGSKNVRRNSGPQLRSLLVRSEDYEYARPGVFRKSLPRTSSNGIGATQQFSHAIESPSR